MQTTFREENKDSEKVNRTRTLLNNYVDYNLLSG